MELINTSMVIGQGVTYSMTSSEPGDDVSTVTQKDISHPQSSSSTAFIVTQVVLYGIILCLGLPLNCFVIWLIRHERSLHTVTNMWVTSLCIIQLLICAISLPIIIISVLADDWLFGSVFCKIFGCYTTCLRTGSILFVAGIALDRYHIVTQPFNTSNRRGPAKIFIAVIWWGGFMASIPPLFGIGQYRYSPSNHMCGISWSLGGSALVFTVFYITSVYVATFMVASCSYKLIHKMTKAQVGKRNLPSMAGGLGCNMATQRSKSIQELGNVSTFSEDMQINSSARPNKKISAARRRLNTISNGKLSRGRGSLRHRLSMSISGYYSHTQIDNRAAVAIILVLVTLLCTWLPYFTLGLYSGVAGNKGYPGPSSAKSWADFITTWLSFSNAIWDPLIYGMLNHNFRARLKKLQCCNGLCFHRVFSTYSGKFRSSDSANNAPVSSRVTSPSTWRKIVETQEIKAAQSVENMDTFVSKGTTDYCKIKDGSSHTITSMYGEASQRHVSSRRQSKVFFVAEKESTLPTDLSPDIMMKQSRLPRRPMSSFTQVTSPKHASQAINFEEDTPEPTPRQAEIGINSAKPLPIDSIYKAPLPSSPLVNKTPVNQNKEENCGGDETSDNAGSKSGGTQLRCQSQIECVSLTPNNSPNPTPQTYSKSSTSLSGNRASRVTNRRLSSESERRRREKVRQVRAPRPRTRYQRTNDSTPAT